MSGQRAPGAGAHAAEAPPRPGAEPAVQLRGLSKSYGPVAALRDVDLVLYPGEVHCLAGENGAGKSTLIKVVAGAEQRDAGTYTVAGHTVPRSLSPVRARGLGVGVVYQELSLLPHLSVADNLLMGRLPSSRGLLRTGRQHDAAHAALARVGLDEEVPVETPVQDLSTAHRQLVEIARALDQDARVIVFDEPTTALSEAEAGRLLERVGSLADQGLAVLYVSHRIEEMFEAGHRVTVLRDGEVADCRPLSESTPDALVESMVGRRIENLYPDSGPRPRAEPLLEVRGLRAPAFPEPVDLSVAAGEIVGLAGLMGAGRSELLQAVFGADRAQGGSVRVDGAAIPLNSPRAAAARGLGMLTEDRAESGLLPHLSIQENIAVAGYAGRARGGWLTPARVREHALSAISGLGLKYRDLNDPVSSLSGGNQQKALLARWLALEARVLLLDEPTKGVDVGSRADIYRIVADLAEAGKAIVVVSSYLPELLGLCDRVVVLRKGRLVADLAAARTSEEEIARYASLDNGAEAGTRPLTRPSAAGTKE